MNRAPRTRDGADIPPGGARRRTRTAAAPVFVRSAAPPDDEHARYNPLTWITTESEIARGGSLSPDGGGEALAESARGPAELAMPRLPPSFSEQMRRLFLAPPNRDFLRARLEAALPRGSVTLSTTLERLDRELAGFFRGRGQDMLESDPLAMRGEEGRVGHGVTLWRELARLNEAFVRDRAAAHELEAEPGDRADYATRAFMADSLFPPGYEDLNGPGSLHAVQPTTPLGALPPAEPEEFVGKGPGLAPPQKENGSPRKPKREGFTSPGGRKNPDLPIARALTEFWDSPEDSALGRAERRPWASYGDCETRAPADALPGCSGQTSQDGACRDAWYWKTPPVWQRTAPRRHETDIEETLGQGGREHEGHVRGWDMARYREGLCRTKGTHGAKKYADEESDFPASCHGGGLFHPNSRNAYNRDRA